MQLIVAQGLCSQEKVGKFEYDEDKAVITLITEAGMSTHILDLNNAADNLKSLSLRVLD